MGNVFTPDQVRRILSEVELSLFHLSSLGHLRHNARISITLGHGDMVLHLDPRIFDPRKIYICTHVKFPGMTYIYHVSDFYDVLSTIIRGIHHAN